MRIFAMPGRRSPSCLASLSALVIVSAFFSASEARPASTAEAFVSLASCQILQMFRDKPEYSISSTGGKGQCITVNNADGGTEEKKDPIFKTAHFTGTGSSTSEGLTTLTVRWDGAPLVTSTPIVTSGGALRFRIDSKPGITQPTAELKLYPSFPGATSGKAIGTVHLAARVVYEDGGTEIELPMPFALSIDGRYTYGIASANPNLGGPLTVIVDPGPCALTEGIDCLWFSQRAASDLSKPPLTDYCYCPNCSDPACFDLPENP
ncbi:MAG TPA: hypothetical protein VGS22_02925 [Thermoanaerobaculia bacterium]|jgi:hypothetical protein|nr:hypothetical protein [Thermoanaerobaculia bacterium]